GMSCISVLREALSSTAHTVILALLRNAFWMRGTTCVSPGLAFTLPENLSKPTQFQPIAKSLLTFW
ncbi:MAG: hypothetical protein NT121_00480, partial [Chloroflexi bacterium]|nr:hypothetical protein [Chloroflexota bacterium]